jgi:aspartyl-tRNA synthetase
MSKNSPPRTLTNQASSIWQYKTNYINIESSTQIRILKVQANLILVMNSVMEKKNFSELNVPYFFLSMFTELWNTKN